MGEELVTGLRAARERGLAGETTDRLATPGVHHQAADLYGETASTRTARAFGGLAATGQSLLDRHGDDARVVPAGEKLGEGVGFTDDFTHGGDLLVSGQKPGGTWRSVSVGGLPPPLSPPPYQEWGEQFREGDKSPARTGQIPLRYLGCKERLVLIKRPPWWAGSDLLCYYWVLTCSLPSCMSVTALIH